MINKVVLGFGSNLGNRLRNLKAAVKEVSLTKGIDFLALSSIYETEPWGYMPQNVFLNCAGIFLCRANPLELIKIIKNIEKKLGRHNREKWRPREIDIDILFYESRIFKNKQLVIPHPLMHQRNFVLKPLVELMPGVIHPKLKKSISSLYLNSKDKGKVSLFKQT